MTLNITSMGQTRTITAVELVEDAFRDCDVEPTHLAPGFIQFWVNAGKSIDEILAIAGHSPSERRLRTA